MSDGWGGARPGAGRPRRTLADIIAKGEFDWRNQRHRRLLNDEDVEDPELRESQDAYRRYYGWADRGRLSWIAQAFAREVTQRGEKDLTARESGRATQKPAARRARD
jgi:hypothetical protein